MKAFIVISLSFLLILCSFGVLPVLSVYQNEIKREMRVHCQSKAGALIVFNSAQQGINWEEKNEEFSYQGRMHDVQRTVDSAGLRYYYCVSDDREDEIIALKDHWQHQEQQLPKDNLAKKIFSLSYVLPVAIAANVQYNVVLDGKRVYHIRPTFYSFAFSRRDILPPEVPWYLI